MKTRSNISSSSSTKEKYAIEEVYTSEESQPEFPSPTNSDKTRHRFSPFSITSTSSQQTQSSDEENNRSSVCSNVSPRNWNSSNYFSEASEYAYNSELEAKLKEALPETQTTSCSSDRSLRNRQNKKCKVYQ